jgi:hypothetical protein
MIVALYQMRKQDQREGPNGLILLEDSLDYATAQRGIEGAVRDFFNQDIYRKKYKLVFPKQAIEVKIRNRRTGEHDIPAVENRAFLNYIGHAQVPRERGNVRIQTIIDPNVELECLFRDADFPVAWSSRETYKSLLYFNTAKKNPDTDTAVRMRDAFHTYARDYLSSLSH